MGTIKGCPFCGYVMQEEEVKVYEGNQIRCPFCQAGGTCFPGTKENKDRAVESWNKRVGELPPDYALRDKFAAAALTGLLAGAHYSSYLENAIEAGEYADAMMEERKRNEKP